MCSLEGSSELSRLFQIIFFFYLIVYERAMNMMN